MDLGSYGWEILPQLLAAVFLTALTGLAMGLLVSALAANSDRAMAIVPILLIPQIMFAGALTPLDRMLLPGRIVSQAVAAKWSLQLLGSMTHLGPRFLSQLPPAMAEPYAREFDTDVWVPWVVLGAFTAAMLATTVIVQKRHSIDRLDACGLWGATK